MPQLPIYLNKITLCGRPVAKRLEKIVDEKTKKYYCNFTLAVPRQKIYKTQKVANRTNADFIRCTAWEQTANYLATYFESGDQIIIEGKIKSTQVVAPDKHSKTSFVSVEILKAQLIKKNLTKAEEGRNYAQMPEDVPLDEPVYQNPFENNPEEVNPDEIPF